MPLWNSYSYCGMPFLANWQSALFYPFNILFYLLPFYIALKLYCFIHFAVAGIFTYLFAVKNKFRTYSSLGMMILFVFNGFLITKLEFLSHIGVDVWVFALFLFVQNPVLAALTASISFMAGHQVFIFQIVIFIFYLFTKAVIIKDYNKISVNLIYTLIIVTGIVAVQLMPLAELTAYSNRFISGIGSDIAMLHSLKIDDVARFLYPKYKAGQILLVTGEKYQWDTTLYVGLISSLIAFYGIFNKRKGELTKIFSLVLILSGFILALGNTTSIYPFLFKNVFLFKTMRYPVQLIYASIIGLTIMFGYGFDGLYKTLNKWVLLSLVLLVSSELLVYGYHFQPLADKTYYYKKHEIVAFIQKNIGAARFLLSPGTEKNRYFRGKDVEDSWQKSRGYLYNLTSLPYHISNAYGFGEPLTLKSVEEFIDKAYKQKTPQDLLPFLDILGVKYLLCRDELKNHEGYELKYNDTLFLYQKIAETRLYECGTPQIKALRRTQDAEYSINTESSLNNVTSRQGGAVIKIVENKPGKITLNSTAPAESTIVWKEAFMPGWKTYVIPSRKSDGIKEINLSEWNDLFRMFKIPSGENRIIQYYLPFSYRVGILITVFTLLLILIYGAIKSTYWIIK
ncbi:MAG: hypothetical protein LHV68_02650 [Elusimicrobia bacterium]|nr:hypothetical protein [Candidatus Liberimonas magnetica]